MAKAPKEEGSMLPIIATNLLANTLEMAMDPEVKGTGKEIRDLGRKNKGSLVLAESAIQSFLQTRPWLSEGAKLQAFSLFDALFDRVRNMPPDADRNSILGKIEDGGRAALALVKGKVGGAAKPLSKFPKYESELTPDQRKLLLTWVLSMRVHQPEFHKRWEALKDKIDSKDRLEFTLGLDEDLRIEYLESVLVGPPGPLDILKAAARGEETPQVTAVKKKVGEFREKVGKSTETHDTDADKILAESRMPKKGQENSWTRVAVAGVLCLLVLIVLFWTRC